MEHDRKDIDAYVKINAGLPAPWSVLLTQLKSAILSISRTTWVKEGVIGMKIHLFYSMVAIPSKQYEKSEKEWIKTVSKYWYDRQ